MTTFEKWSLIIGVSSALVTLLAVIVALFGEKLRQIWSAPKLRVALRGE